MSAPQWLVLVIEDEPPIRRFLRLSLESENFRLLEASTGAEGLTLAASHRPDLILLDLGLPDLDGLEVITRLRQWCAAPIIIVSARGKEHDKVRALDLGADDYLTKPFGIAELKARLRVAMRHSARLNGQDQSPVFKSGALTVDLGLRKVWLAEQEVRLTPIEFKLLALMVRHAGKVVTHRQLQKEVWGRSGEEPGNNLRFYIHHLRHKLEPDPARPGLLRTETGVGYRLVCQD